MIGTVDELESAFEMVGVQTAVLEGESADGTVTDYGAIEILARDGFLRVHAVKRSDMEPGVELTKTERGTAQRRLCPTFWLWEDAHPEQMIRCPECLKLHPLPAIPGPSHNARSPSMALCSAMGTRRFRPIPFLRRNLPSW